MELSGSPFGKGPSPPLPRMENVHNRATFLCGQTPLRSFKYDFITRASATPPTPTSPGALIKSQNKTVPILRRESQFLILPSDAVEKNRRIAARIQLSEINCQWRQLSEGTTVRGFLTRHIPSGQVPVQTYSPTLRPKGAQKLSN